jgi:hypothetical protein
MGLCVMAAAQNAPTAGQDERGGRRMGMGEGVGGQITAIEGQTITLQSFRGETAKVRIGASTEITKDRAPAKLSDFKVGDRVMVGGKQDKDGIWIAERMGGRSGQGGGEGRAAMNPADNGKTFIAGEVARIDGARLTIQKPDGGQQVIEVDDETSFRNEARESITLADIKVGQFVHGQGAVKDGVFVPKVLGTGRPRMGAGAPPQGAGAPQTGSAPAGQPQQ